MSQADELLATASESTAELGEAVVGTAILGFGALSQGEEGNIAIGVDRIIKVPDGLKRIAVQFDHNIETVTFDCPRYWDGLDMSAMSVYINYRRSDKVIGCFKAVNVAVDESDTSVMHFDWTISKNVTMAKGPLSFLVCIKKADEDGNEENHWNSELNQEMYISEGLESGEPIAEEYPDIIGQLEVKNQAMIDEITNQLLADRDAGLFNPTVEATRIAGGYILTITSGPNITEFEILDGSTESIRNFMVDYVAISDTEPAAGPAFWFDNSDLESSAVVMKYKDGDGVVTTLFPVTHIDNVQGMEDVVAHVNSKDNPHETTAAQIGAVANKAYTTTGTGAAYLAEVEGITELVAGVSFVMIPHAASTNVTPTLNVNSLGAKGIRRHLSSATGSVAAGSIAGWLTIGSPVRVTYDGEYWVVDITQPDAEDISGELPVLRGGTGKSSWEPYGLIYAPSAHVLDQVPCPTADLSILRKNVYDAPYWSTVEELTQDMGAVRLMIGSYTGRGTAGNLDLVIKPKILCIRLTSELDGGSSAWFHLLQNETYSRQMTGYDGNAQTLKYTTTVTLGESTLVFGGDIPSDLDGDPYYYMNLEGVTYTWYALY